MTDQTSAHPDQSRETNFDRYVAQLERDPETKKALDEAREHFRAEAARIFGDDDPDIGVGAKR